MNLPPELQSALLGKRIIFLRGRLDEAVANTTIAQLLLVAGAAQPGQTIELYLDSPGGSRGAALAVYDVLRTLQLHVSTVCTGRAGGASVLVLAGGTHGLRFALPHARIGLKEETAADPAASNPNDLPHHAAEAARVRGRWLAALAEHTAHSQEQVARDLSMGRWLSTAEARDYGLVDGIIPGPRATFPGGRIA